MTPAQIKQRRIALGLTREDIAALFRVGVRSVYYWETEGRNAMPWSAQLVLMAMSEVRGFRAFVEAHE